MPNECVCAAQANKKGFQPTSPVLFRSFTLCSELSSINKTSENVLADLYFSHFDLSKSSLSHN